MHRERLCCWLRDASTIVFEGRPFQAIQPDQTFKLSGVRFVINLNFQEKDRELAVILKVRDLVLTETGQRVL